MEQSVHYTCRSKKKKKKKGPRGWVGEVEEGES